MEPLKEHPISNTKRENTAEDDVWVRWEGWHICSASCGGGTSRKATGLVCGVGTFWHTEKSLTSLKFLNPLELLLAKVALPFPRNQLALLKSHSIV